MKSQRVLIICLSLLIISGSLLFSQQKKELIWLVKEDSVILIPTVAPPADHGLNFYKKISGNQFQLLNIQGPVTPITSGDEILKIFGNRWDEVAAAYSIKDPADLVYLISETESAFFLMSLKYPEVLKIAGCWFVDKNSDGRKETEYKIEYLDNKRNPVDAFTKKVILKESKPLPVSNLKAEVDKSSISLSWNYPEWKGSNSDLTTQFVVYRKTQTEDYKKLNSGVILRNDLNPPEYADFEIESGKEYSYYVTAADIIGVESIASQTVMATWKDNNPPSIPEDIIADSVEGAIGISWKMNLELDTKGYNIYRSLKINKEFTKLNTEIIPLDKTFYYDNTFDFGIQYFYCLTSVDNSGNESEKCNPLAIVYEDLVAPEPPGNFKYTVENKIIKFSWSSSVSPDVEGYHFYRGESKEVIPRVTENGLKSLTYTDSGFAGKGFTPGKRYTFAITAVDRGRNESPKIFLEDIFIPDNEPPAAPEGFITENGEGNYIDISCGSSSSEDVALYKIFKGNSENNMSPREFLTFNRTPFQFRDTAITKPKTYIYYAVAYDSAGNESQKSRIDTVSARDFTPPPSPRYIKAKIKGTGAEITWEKVFDYDLYGYNIYKSQLPNGVYEKINKEVIFELSYFDSLGKTSDFYKVKAIDTSGNESTKGDPAFPE
ncbi:MAG: fibronectin type III domain-containing protein [Ignavibacteriaceae bacterium]